jgi:hypothetical protein
MGGTDWDCPEDDSLVLFARSTASVAYQLWVLECFPEHIGETRGVLQEWLRLAAWSYTAERFSSEDLGVIGAYRAADSLELKASEAVSAHLTRSRGGDLSSPDNMNWPGLIRCIQRVSRALEEGHRAGGTIAFLSEAAHPRARWITRINSPTPISLSNSKHIVKLLQSVSEDDKLALAASNTHLLGILRLSESEVPVRAQFTNGAALVTVGSDHICRVHDGRFRSIIDRGSLLARVCASLSVTEGPTPPEGVLRSIGGVLDSAECQGFGCTFAYRPEFDTGQPSSHWLEDPIKLSQETAAANTRLVSGMARVDGAVLVDSQSMVRGFGAILTGHGVDGEDLSRGARFNSALRYSALYPDSIVITQSQDGPLAVFYGGRAVLDLRTADVGPLGLGEVNEAQWTY